MRRVDGKVTVGSRSIAYCDQTAWILNATVQDNILFGRPMQQAAFDKVWCACT